MAAAFQYFGEEFHFSGEVDAFAITEFAEALDDGADASGLRGLAVAWRLALSCVAEDEQTRFRVVSRKNKAAAEAYLRVFRDRMELDADRPTGLPTDSSSGQESTPQKSASQHADSATAPSGLDMRSRLALAVVQAESA